MSFNLSESEYNILKGTTNGWNNLKIKISFYNIETGNNKEIYSGSINNFNDFVSFSQDGISYDTNFKLHISEIARTILQEDSTIKNGIVCVKMFYEKTGSIFSTNNIIFKIINISTANSFLQLSTYFSNYNIDGNGNINKFPLTTDQDVILFYSFMSNIFNNSNNYTFE